MMIRDVYVAVRAISELHCGAASETLARGIAASDRIVQERPVEAIESLIEAMREALGDAHAHVDLAVDLLAFYALQDESKGPGR